MFQSFSGKDVKFDNYDFTAGLGLKPMLEIIEEIVEEIERSLIEKALAQTKGNKPDAANLLGISRAGLYNKLQKYKPQYFLDHSGNQTQKDCKRSDSMLFNCNANIQHNDQS